MVLYIATWASPGVVLRAQRKHVRFDTPECDHVSDEGSRSKSISTSISEDAPPSAVRVESPRKRMMIPNCLPLFDLVVVLVVVVVAVVVVVVTYMNAARLSDVIYLEVVDL